MKDKVIVVRVSKELKTLIEKSAEKDRRSVSSFIRTTIENIIYGK